MNDAFLSSKLALYDEIMQSVEFLLSLYEKFDGNSQNFKMKQMKQRIDYNEGKINELILDIYGITDITGRNLILHS